MRPFALANLLVDAQHAAPFLEVWLFVLCSLIVVAGPFQLHRAIRSGRARARDGEDFDKATDPDRFWMTVMIGIVAYLAAFLALGALIARKLHWI